MSQPQRKSRRLSDKLSNKNPGPSTSPKIPQLSADLLGLIFERARPDTIKYPKDDNEAASQFPYNFAAVCKQWREVLSLTAEYWTTPIFYVDSTHPTPLDDVTSFLEWSKNLMIVVEVKRSPEAEDDDSDPGEGKRTRAVIDALKPHVHRCLIIHFDVIHGSSLPSLSRDLFNISPDLIGLSLLCKADDGPPVLEKIGPVQKVVSQPIFVQVLSGHTIYDALANAPQNFKGLTKAQVLFFSCLDYKAYSKSQTVAVTDLFGAFGCPEALEFGALCHLNLPYKPYPTGSPRIAPKAKKLVLAGLVNATMRTTFDHLDFHAVSLLCIKYCSLVEISISGPRQLSLEGITDDLCKPLSNWKGSVVCLKNCPTVNDSLLDLFSGQTGSESVQHISLENCPNFSVNGLQRLCMMRRAGGGVPIMSIRVSGRAPEIHQEDVEYLAVLVGEDLTSQTGFFEWKGPILQTPESFEDSLRPTM